MKHEFAEGRLLLERTAEERKPILERLRRVEGQIRGIQQMVEQDRYCLDELQQVNAVVAAMREVSLIIVSQHLNAGLERAIAGEDVEASLEEIRSVLRSAMRQS